jgi:hypothetical protein
MSSKRSFAKQIQASMGSLLKEHGFSLLEEREEPDHFGNALAVFQSPLIRLRFIRDRGDILVDVAENGQEERWHKLENILRLCKPVYNYAARVDAEAMRRLIQQDMATRLLRNDMDSVKHVLSENLGTIEGLFSPHRIEFTKRLLHDFERKESQAIATRIFGKGGSSGKAK